MVRISSATSPKSLFWLKVVPHHILQGVPFARRAVGDGLRLWSSFEDVSILIAGPRTGKTTCWVEFHISDIKITFS